MNVLKQKVFSLLFLVALLSGCHKQEKVEGVYRYYWGEKSGYHIWIVDGYKVRHKIYDSFLYGGNEQRYIFNPKGEIWIDHAISCEEFELTLAHEMNERHLMAKFGWTYYKAHDSSLMVELKMRRQNEMICKAHETSLTMLPATDYNGVREISGIPDSIRLNNIYRIPLGERNGMKIWIVDGYQVRKTIYPDFGFSGNDKSYHFIPSQEIWLDGQISCEESEYCIATELTIRDQMSKGKNYSDAYSSAILENDKRRDQMEEIIRQHPPVVVPEVLARDTGIVDRNEK